MSLREFADSMEPLTLEEKWLQRNEMWEVLEDKLLARKAQQQNRVNLEAGLEAAQEQPAGEGARRPLEDLPDGLVAEVLDIDLQESAAWSELLHRYGDAAFVFGAAVMPINALVSERMYQDQRWDQEKFGNRSVDEFSLYIYRYAGRLIANNSDEGESKLDMIRKVGALCVAAMEQHGAPKREGF